MKSLPKLYKKTSTGAIQTWSISTDNNVIITTYGQLNGKMQEARDTITEGKNLGKINATTPAQQAETEAKAQWEGKVKKGYVEVLDDATAGKVNTDVITGGVSPMLAHVYSKQGHKIIFPAAVQPKLDGHRCIAVVKDGKATLWSRTRKPITSMPHITAALENSFNEDIILDGELYNHDYRDKFEELTSLIRPEEPKEGCGVVQYYIYDVIGDGTFEERFRKGLNFQPTFTLQDVVTVAVMDEQQLMEVFAKHRAQGYEGSIVRNLNSSYENKRSYNLQKVKEFDDNEYEIVDVVAGRGKLTNMGMFICKTSEGKTFEVKIIGELDGLKKYLEKPQDYIGKKLTVQHQGFSTYGIPRFGVGLRLREDV